MRLCKSWLASVLCTGMILGLAGCAASETTVEIPDSKEVQIPMILTVDSTTGKRNEKELVDAFNKEYEGQYEVDVEWIMETEEEYRQNLKRQNAIDKLPAIITDLRMLPSFYQMMIQEGRIEDLTPYIEADPEWKESIEPVVLEGCTEEDGRIYLSPLSTAAFACSGVFWNEELFAEAGITSFPQTWEEFWACCEQLEASGVTPLGLHTEGTAWAPMLLATAEVAKSEEGEQFMKQLYPESYQNAAGEQIANSLKRLFQYTTEDALHNDFDVAHTNFISGKVAMVPNGYWMIDQIPEEMEGKVHFSPFPGNELIGSPETFGWAIVSSYPEEVKEGAVAFFRFRTMRNAKEKEQFIGEKAEGIDSLTKDYIQAFTGNPKIVPNYQVKWNSILQEELLGEALPELINERITVEQFLQMEDESVKTFWEEQ